MLNRLRDTSNSANSKTRIATLRSSYSLLKTKAGYDVRCAVIYKERNIPLVAQEATGNRIVFLNPRAPAIEEVAAPEQLEVRQ